MANNRFNKQVSPKGYKMGGRAKKMGGGMMMQRPMMKKGGVASEAKKKQFKANQANQKTTTKKVLKAIVGPFNPISAGQNVVKKIKERMGKKIGGSLKPVQPNQKGLKKLPTEVRNKMGYMKKGGVVSDAKKKQFKENKAGQKVTNKKAMKIAKGVLNFAVPAVGAAEVGKKIARKFKGAK